LLIREDWLRTAQMRPGLSEKIGKARDPGPLADDVEKIAMLARGSVGELAGRARSRRGPSQPYKERPARVVLQIAHDPVGSLPPSGGKVSATDAFSILRKSADHIFGLGIHDSTTSARM
jgi:hypothetical protein